MNRKYIVIFLIPFLVGIQTQGNKKVKFDGLYMTEVSGSGEDASRSYLRFYPNDTVISVSGSGTPGEVNEWFNLDHKYIHRGKYTINKKGISFTTQLATQKIEYSGHIKGKTLTLHWKSHINGKEGDRIYIFSKIKTQKSK